MHQGWVYIFVNASIPGYAKVGRTHRQPLERAQELSASTGVPTPFVLAFAQDFDDCVEAERLVHNELDRRGMRISQHREFFRASVSEIIRIILDFADRVQPPTAVVPSACADRLFMMAEQTLHGIGERLQDTNEALRLFKLATARGSLAAFERIGEIYASSYFAHREPAMKRRAMTAFKEGAGRGNYYCYGRLAEIFASDRHRANFTKSWDLFFSRRADSFRPDLEQETDHYAAALARYIQTARALDLNPDHLPQLNASINSVMAQLLHELDAAHGEPRARRRIAATLHWCYESLLPAQSPLRMCGRTHRVPSPHWVTQPSGSALA